MDYDYIIVGGGPAGLTCATYLARINKKILIIEKEQSIGGCHRVKRVDGLMTEHGPRVYSSNFVNFRKVLAQINLNFHDLFTPYNFSISSIAGSGLQHLKLREMFILAYYFITLNKKSHLIPLEQVLAKHNFSEKATWYIDRLCRLTDGAGIEKYTLYQFLQNINQNTLYRLYQPVEPNDLGLFKHWKDYLEDLGVTILTGTAVRKIEGSQVFVGEHYYSADKIILAMSPWDIVKLQKQSGIYLINPEWEKQVRYNRYIPITFHWKNKVNLPKVWGYPKTDWGIVHVVLSDYMNLNSPTVISTSISVFDSSSYLGKTPDECSKDELIEEVLRQLRLSYPDLPNPDKSIMDYPHKVSGKWHVEDLPFMLTEYGYIPFSTEYDNIYICGTQNGASTYPFTSAESAVKNAIKLVNTLEDTKIHLSSSFTIRQVFMILLVFIIIIILINIIR